jgi:hypothetical protein
MSVVKQVIGTRNSLPYTSTGLSALASDNYVRNTTAYDCSTNLPLDVIIEVVATPGAAPSNNKQLVVYIQESLDGTNFRGGPYSSNVTTEEPNLRPIGYLPMTVSGTQETGFFSLMQVLGFVPRAFYIVIKNDCGATLSSGAVFTAEISNTVT